MLQEVPELTFFDWLPTTWDETRVLDGYLGSHATIARRKGTTWFLACLNGSTKRNFHVPLDFLDPSKSFEAEIFVDDPSQPTTTKVRAETRDVAYTSALHKAIGTANGFTAIFTEKGPFVIPPPDEDLPEEPPVVEPSPIE